MATSTADGTARQRRYAARRTMQTLVTKPWNSAMNFRRNSFVA
jgi:hypothetical protein